MKDKLKKVKKPTALLKPKKKLAHSNKLKMEKMSVDDFMNSFSEKSLKSSKNKGKSIKKLKKKVEVDEDDTNEFENSSMNSIDDDSEEENAMDGNSDEEIDLGSHKKQLEGLKKSDPEFYKYLEQNDQELLNFDDSDLDSDKEKEEEVHKLPDKLEVASDESDYEPDQEVVKARHKTPGNKITNQMILKWQEQLRSKDNITALREVVEAFHAAVVSVSPDEEVTSRYKVEGAAIFNAIIRMCVVDFLPGIQKTLKMKTNLKIHPEKCKNWAKVKPVLRNYFIDLIELSGATSPNMLSVLLKHIHQMSIYIACFPSISVKYLKRIIQLWGMDEDVVRVLAFLCALKFGNLRPSLLKHALKIMHLTYVKNTRFVSPNTLPGINFMRQSLCEMLALDTTTSYHMGFIYIRQLAIHLRNAVTLKKKESMKTVYNWAYISSLHLWSELFGLVSRDSPLKSLIYPLVQIIIGTIKLIPSSQYFPLRFHCVRILINLSNKCGVFIPVLPFLLEVLRDFNFNREHKKLSMKPMDLTCLLRCSKSQMKENGFKDAIIENVHDLLIEYLATECHRISFPDMTVPCVIQLKQFLKTCTVANYTKKLKAILDKISENSKFIENERKKLNIKLYDLSGVEAAETALRAKQPPFLKYYENWKKVHTQQQARKITNSHQLGDFKLPVLYKLDKKRSRVETKSIGPPELFPSDDEDSDSGGVLKEMSDSEPEPEPPKKKKKKKDVTPQKKQQTIMPEDLDDFDDEEDLVTDLNYSDL